MVANPYTLLSRVPPQHCWYSVVDLKDALWACPLAEECRNISAFSWEDPDMGQKQQLQWTRLPQGYTESPTLFGHAVEELLQSFPTPSVIQVIQYVDDILLSGEEESTLRKSAISLLNFPGTNGLRVSKN